MTPTPGRFVETENGLIDTQMHPKTLAAQEAWEETDERIRQRKKAKEERDESARNTT